MDDDERLAEYVSARWREIDPAARVIARARADGKLDLTLVSQLFEAKQSDERETLFWPSVRDLPAEDRVRMTYVLLLSPAEADAYF